MPRSNYYTPPSKPPQTRWARHIDAWMRANGLSKTGAFKRLGSALGLGPDSRSAFLPYLYNKPVADAHARELAAIIGWPPEEAEPEPQPTPDLASALSALATELRALREERTALVARVDELDATVKGLLQVALPGAGSGAGASAPVPRP